MSDENTNIVTNGVELTDDVRQRLMETFKDNEDFDMGENGDAASCRLGFSESSGNNTYSSATSQKLVTQKAVRKGMEEKIRVMENEK